MSHLKEISSKFDHMKPITRDSQACAFQANNKEREMEKIQIR